MLTVYACQTDIVWEDKTANFARVRNLLEATRQSPQPGGLIVLPEMFATGFSMNARAIAEDVRSGETADFLADLARRSGCHVLAGMVTVTSDLENPARRPYNEAVVVAPDGTLAGRYRKRRPFTPSGERDRYVAGSSPVVLEIGGIRVAPLICYDLRFPELFRVATAVGTDLFCVISNWPDRRQHHQSLLLRARAIENQAFVLGVNRCGSDPHFVYAGGSALIDPHGEVLTEAGSAPTFLRATISPQTTAAWRAQFPALRDRRTDLFPA